MKIHGSWENRKNYKSVGVEKQYETSSCKRSSIKHKVGMVNILGLFYDLYARDQDLFDVYFLNINWGQTGWIWEDNEERRWMDSLFLGKTIQSWTLARRTI